MAKKKKNRSAPEVTIEETAQPEIPAITAEEFEQSVCDAEVAGGEIATKRKISRTANFIQLALIFICAAVFIVCSILLIQNIWGKIKGENIYSGAAEQFEVFIPGEKTEEKVTLYAPMAKPADGGAMQTLFDRLSSGTTDSTSGASEYSEQIANMKASLSSLRDINDDVYGWIYVPGTRINYPILKGDDNAYYLNHAYNHEVVPIGSVFVDCHNTDALEDNYNLVLYGHNVEASGQMFHDVTNFLKADVFNSTLIYIYTMDGVYIYQPSAIYATTADNFYYDTQFSSEAEFITYANAQIANSQHAVPSQFTIGDKMLTLSTCTNGVSGSGRYAMHAKLIEIIK